MVYCPTCGAELRFDIVSQAMVCGSCKNSFDPGVLTDDSSHDAKTEEYFDSYAFDGIDQARLKRKELFEFDSACIFAINMNVRKITIQSYGKINESITDSYARSITDNVKNYATAGNYFNCASAAFSQMLDVCENRSISEPLKVSGYIIISLMLGFIIAIGIAFSKKHNPMLQSWMFEDNSRYKAVGGLKSEIEAYLIKETTVYRPPSDSGSSGGGGCSSCSSGGGCGSGGSASF